MLVNHHQTFKPELLGLTPPPPAIAPVLGAAIGALGADEALFPGKQAAASAGARIDALPAGPLKQALVAVRATGDRAAATRALALAQRPDEAALALQAAQAYVSAPAPGRVAERAYRDQLVAFDQALTAALGRVPDADGGKPALREQVYRPLDAAIAAALYAQRVPNAKASRQDDAQVLGSEAGARAAFRAERAALLDVSNWKAFNPVFSTATFTLADADGKPVHRVPREGDFVKINVGPGLDDWVRVERIREDDDHLAITVRPSYDPTRRPLTPAVTSHFFTSDATNVFMVDREGAKVSTRVYGFNERANTATVAKGGEARDFLVAGRNKLIDLGSAAGGQLQQWFLFTKGLARVGAIGASRTGRLPARVVG